MNIHQTELNPRHDVAKRLLSIEEALNCGFDDAAAKVGVWEFHTINGGITHWVKDQAYRLIDNKLIPHEVKENDCFLLGFDADNEIPGWLYILKENLVNKTNEEEVLL